jgi:hypothetical protein
MGSVQYKLQRPFVEGLENMHLDILRQLIDIKVEANMGHTPNSV